ncbi:histidine phosphatase family protein [Planctomycetota bacterium]
MEIYLMRHGKAEAICEDGDPARSLTPAGEESIIGIGRALAGMGISFDVIFASTLARAMQTGKLIGAQTNPGLTPVPSSELAYGEDLGRVLNLLREYPQASRALFVGHQPRIERWIGELVSTVGDVSLRVGTGCIGCIEIFSIPPREPGVLNWFCNSAQLDSLIQGP